MRQRKKETKDTNNVFNETDSDHTDGESDRKTRRKTETESDSFIERKKDRKDEIESQYFI